jgi:hypothetical protein
MAARRGAYERVFEAKTKFRQKEEATKRRTYKTRAEADAATARARSESNATAAERRAAAAAKAKGDSASARSGASVAAAAQRAEIETKARRERLEQRAAMKASQSVSSRSMKGNVATTVGMKAASVGASAVTAPFSGTQTVGAGSVPMLILYVMGALIVFYLLVSRSDQTGGFFGNLGSLFHALSSDTPLFTKKPTTQ